MRSLVNQHVAALRALLILTLVLGLAYPLAITAFAAVPGVNPEPSVGRAFTAADEFHPRPSANDYDPLATGASNLGPESVVDAPDAPSLLTQVCARSLAVGELEGVDGARPYCTDDGVGAVLGVFPDRVVSLNQACPATAFAATYQGVRVECAEPGEDYSAAQVVPVRGDATAVVPADAVTASGSGLDPHVSPAYAALQVDRVARERGADPAAVEELVAERTSGRVLGFLGEPTVDVVRLNADLDRAFPRG